VALTLMRSWSGTFEVDMSEAELERGEREAVEREKALMREAEQVEQIASGLATRIVALRSRVAGAASAPQTASLTAELSTIQVPETKRPASWAAAIEARVAALRARHAAHDALEQETSKRSKSLSKFAATAAHVEAMVTEAERWMKGAVEQRNALAKTVIRARAASDLERAMSGFESSESAPIPLTQVAAPKAQTAPTLVPSPAERRAHSRVSIETEVSMESDSNFFAGFAEDISAGGLFVATHSYQPVGTPIDLSFRIGRASINAQAVVRWVREVDDKNPDMVPGMGVQFTSLPAGAQDAILRFVESREPLFYAD
jgi:uncharacterized protein (TIGR02266 family)